MSPVNIESDLGLFSSRFKGVAIPKTFMNTMEPSIEFFNSEIKKCAHATVGGKIVSAIAEISSKARNSSTYKKDMERRERLNKLFRGVYYYYEEAEKYFKGCKGIDKIKKYNKKIQSQYKRLLKKKYINELTKGNGSNNLFPKEKYDLSFANSDSIPSKTLEEKFLGKETGSLMSLPKFAENTNYKVRCELLYSYLQAFFSTCLFMMNTTYQEAFGDKDRIDGLAGAAQATFNNAMHTLENSLKCFNQCVSIVDKEVAEHKFYFNSDDNKKEMRKVNRSIKETRRYFETMLSAGKRLSLDSEFVFLDKEGKKAYEELVDMLKGINDNLNQIVKYISKGDYNEFKRNYEEVVTYFKQLPELVEKFKNSRSYQVSASAEEELKRYKISLEKLAEDAKALQEKTDAFTKEFEKSYQEFKTKVTKMAVLSVGGGLAKFAASFIPFLGSAGGVFDSFMSDFKILCRNTHLPGIE